VTHRIHKTLRVTDRLWSIGDMVAILEAWEQKQQRGGSLAMNSDDPQNWRARAEEVRMVAGQVFNLESRRTLLEIADSYEHMAVRAEQRLRDAENSK